MLNIKNRLKIACMVVATFCLNLFLTPRNVKAITVESIKSKILYSAGSHILKNMKKHILAGGALATAGALSYYLLRPSDDSEDINQSNNDLIDKKLFNVHILGNCNKKPILKSLGLIENECKFGETIVGHYVLKYPEEGKYAQVFSLSHENKWDFTSKIIIENQDGLNVLVVDLDDIENKNKVIEDSRYWMDLIKNSKVNKKKIIFIFLHNGNEKAKGRADDLYFDDIGLDAKSRELEILGEGKYFISKDSNSDEDTEMLKELIVKQSIE